jgi:DNA-binding transcriptional LysR family regulator
MLDLSLDALAVLDAIAHAGSFAAAAKRLNRVPSSVSYAVQKLEQTLGVPVFERHAQGARFTAAGQVMLERGRLLLAEAEAVAEAARGAARAEQGRLCVGTAEVGARLRLARAGLRAYRERWPAADVAVVELDSPTQRDALRRGSIDAGLVYRDGPAVDDLAAAPLADDPLECALLAATHPLAGRPRLSLADLTAETLLLFRRAANPASYDALQAAFAAARFSPARVHDVSGSLATWALVADGAGWAPKPRSYQADPPAGTVAVPLADLSVPLCLDLLWRRTERAPHVLAFVEVMRGLAA